MVNSRRLDFLKDVLDNMPSDWLKLTTHRLDIYNEELAKTEFLNQFEVLFNANDSEPSSLYELPTAFDYIRLGHPLSCILEWALADTIGIEPNSVISFSSKTAPILAVLRKNLLDNKDTQILYTGRMPDCFDAEVLRTVYGYTFSLKHLEKEDDVPVFNGTTILISEQNDLSNAPLPSNIDFYINLYSGLGSVLMVNGERNKSYISEIQHVRRRETIAMTPANSLKGLRALAKNSSFESLEPNVKATRRLVSEAIKEITGSNMPALVGSSGLSIQYAILMGLIHDAFEKHGGKTIKIIVPPNCYGGTNDQARRIAACIDNVSVVDLPVDGENDMTESIDLVLDRIASEGAIPYIIAEIPTNPRVEVPDLKRLSEVLSVERRTDNGEIAIDPVFILDQTFCPNVHFIREDELLSSVRTISYVSGSKFPSGGLCNAGYCTGNQRALALMEKIELHLNICDNEATNLQFEILAKQLPSMNRRIQEAYENTREFVTFIKSALPDAKINFVSEELAKKGFTPSVFSLDLPTKGRTDEEKEAHKRALNLKLIDLMINEIPDESKFCVSYGQLKGCYWTVPATSTQGTTKEGDKDYIVRVALSPRMDLDLHKRVFSRFVESM